jgi:RNA polymerase sigma-70 factor (ECF subfamily)
VKAAYEYEAGGLVHRDDTVAAWRAIEERLRPFLARRVSHADVEDVLQEVLLRMYRGIRALRDEDRFAAWTYQVARSAVADHLRARARHPLVPGGAEARARPEPEPSTVPAEPDDGIGARELAAYLAPLVAHLPSPYREAITLVELEGQTQADAARLTGISLSGMKSRVQRGRRRLRELLDACCAIALDARGKVLSAEPRDTSDPDCCRPVPRARASAARASSDEHGGAGSGGGDPA